MNAIYTPSKIKEYLSALAAINAVKSATEYDAEQFRLTAAEDALLEDGWKNEESESELREMIAS